jgi:N-acetylneuraminic acid mutarotase
LACEGKHPDEWENPGTQLKDDLLNNNMQLPAAVTNNAVAGTTDGDLFSLMGLGQPKTSASITNTCFTLNTNSNSWLQLPNLADAGRIAATAQAVQDRIFLFGGYSVASDGSEHTSASVNIFDRSAATWTRGKDIPIPVDDSLSALYLERYVYLISGWSETKNVSNVQIYDTETDCWEQATPIAGVPLFGHFGTCSDNQLFYFDGVSDQGRKFSISDVCWRGSIDLQDHMEITWSQMPAHPGPARYRAGCQSSAGKLLIVGGTDNPYNFNGTGYDGKPATPLQSTLTFDLSSCSWDMKAARCNMDLRGLVRRGHSFVSIGGMTVHQTVSADLLTFDL